MTPERWSQVKGLLARALARPEHERDEYLRHACGSDDRLYFEVSKLIEGQHPGSSLIDPNPTTDPFQTQGDNRIGRVLKGRYRIKSRLGSGGVGVVYLAEDLNLMSRLVVVKFLHEHGRTEPGKLVKFLQEAEALARLDHPGIVAAFDADETPEGAHFLVMQYVDGRTLRAVIDDGPLELPRTASILRQLGSALEAAHKKGVIHRDLKPENIMLQKLGDGREIVKIIDFGVARVEASTVSTDTAVIGMAGTPSYMAPEHLSGKPVAASDIFSVAVVAFEMLTGKRPFTAKQPFTLRQQHKHGIPAWAVRKLRPETPVQAENAIREALHFNASDRPSSAQQFCDVVGLSLEDAAAPKPPVSRRKWAAVSLAGVGAFGAAAAALWYGTREVSPSGSKILAESSGALDPLEQGFRIRDDLQFSPLRNRERTGFDRLDLRSGEQGSFYKKLAMQDIRAADASGWKVSLKARPIIGGIWASADFRAINGPRFDVSFYREPDGRALALLCTQLIPTYEGPRYEMPDQGAAPHLLELVYDPATKTCQLFVDGRRQIAGYKGHRQQQAKDPVDAFFFGISVYRSDRAEAEVEMARFEIL